MMQENKKQRPSTVLEPIADFDQLLDEPGLGGQEVAPLVSQPEQAKKAKETGQKTKAYRPSLRPPMALLQIHDDGCKSHETVRIRKEKVVIGRDHGDLQIEHDSLISGEHAEIIRKIKNGDWKWYLRDLNSTNGTFARISKAVLSDGMLLLIGAKRYRFDLNVTAESSIPDPPATRGPTTQMWPTTPEATASSKQPTLVEILSDTDGKTFAIKEGETWIGRDATKSTIVLDDEMVGSRHARIVQDPDGNWTIEVTQTRNGLWLKISGRQELGKSASFQCGEQRFNFRIV